MKRKLILSSALCLFLSASKALAITPATVSVCKSLTTTLSFDGAAGGTWSSSNTKATVSSSGVVTGVSVGTATISYVSSSGTETAVVTILDRPSDPTVSGGIYTVCAASTKTMTSSPAGGTWSSGSPLIASVDASGIVTGVSGGTATISYTNSSGCSGTRNITVYDLPAAITGTKTVCTNGATTTLSSATPGGTWTGPAPASTYFAINASTGVITTVSNPGLYGIGTVYYTLSSGCKVSADVTTNPVPSGITGGSVRFCVGESRTLSNVSGGGTWTSSNPGVADIDATTGIVTGMGAGTPTISYSFTSTGCFRTTTVTVNSLPVVSGSSFVCSGGTTTLSGSAGSGGGSINSWGSTNTSVATINSSGVVTGVSGGTTTITVKDGQCTASHLFTVGGTPGAITGPTTVCVGTSIALSNALGGTWSASDGTGSVSVNPTTGIVTGVTAGTATVTYSNTCGSPATIVITVVPSAGAISGAPIIDICETSTLTLTSSVSGGTWTSSNPSVATINASTGELIGANLWDIDMGATCSLSTVITYGFYAGCSTTVTVNVNDKADSLKRKIPGVAGWDNTNLCPGLRYYINSSNEAYWGGCGGGSWTSSNSSVADVVWGPFRVRAIAPGTATIIHQRGNGCTTTLAVTVSAATSVLSPSTPVIQGDFYDDRGEVSICEGSTTTISCSEINGVWGITSNIVGTPPITIADVVDNDPTVSHLVLSGVHGGEVITPVVTYTHDNKCRGLYVRVYPETEAISGDETICYSATTTYEFTNTVAYGEWSSSSPKLQLVGTGDNMTKGRFITTGGTGTVTISYETGCGTVTKDVEIVSCGARFAQGSNGHSIENLETRVLNYSLIPNPGNGNVTISADQELDGNVEMSVLNYTGAVVYTSPVTFKNGKTNLNLTHLSTGMYFVVLKDKTATKTLKIVIQK